MSIPVSTSQFSGFAVQPKKDCPHSSADCETATKAFLTQENCKTNACETCHDKSQNWLCMQCRSVFCSQYVGSHMKEHNVSSKHPVVFSLTDGSFWCYQCDSYITSVRLIQVARRFSALKFPEQSLAEEMASMKLDGPEGAAELAAELKAGMYKKVVFLTGAGISVKAGIPDFRTPGTGLYSQLQKYKLPRPQAVFSIEFFRQNPVPFYQVSKQFLVTKCKPVTTHHFIKAVHQHKMLLKCITQNIDGLQLQAGLPTDKLIQAHGHYRSYHCIDCRKQHPRESFEKAVAEIQPLKCACGSLVKPDVVFFGQKLPSEFHQAYSLLKQADLVIVAGTSLKVFPFAALIEVVPAKVPIILINREDSLEKCANPTRKFLGDIDEIIGDLAKALDWHLQ